MGFLQQAMRRRYHARRRQCRSLKNTTEDFVAQKKSVRVVMEADPGKGYQLKCHQPVELVVATVHSGIVSRDVSEGHWVLTEHMNEGGGWDLQVTRFGEQPPSARTDYPDWQSAELGAKVRYESFDKCLVEIILQIEVTETWPYVFDTLSMGHLRMRLKPGRWTLHETLQPDGKTWILSVTKESL